MANEVIHRPMTSYTTGQFAALLGKHPRTVQRWDSAGLLVADRSPKGRRMYTDRHVALARGIDEEDTSIQTRAVIAYSRVSSPGTASRPAQSARRPGNLLRRPGPWRRRVRRGDWGRHEFPSPSVSPNH